jgi:hypothetical protein
MVVILFECLVLFIEEPDPSRDSHFATPDQYRLAGMVGGETPIVLDGVMRIGVAARQG